GRWGRGVGGGDQAWPVAEHHAQERAALPQIELEQARFLGAVVVEPPGRAFADAVATEVGVDGRHDIAPLRQQRAEELAVPGVGAHALLRAAMPVQGNDGGGGVLSMLRSEEDAGPGHVRAVVELEAFLDVISAVLPGNDADLGRIRPGRHLAQAVPERRADLGAIPLVPTLQVRGQWPFRDPDVPERRGHFGPRRSLLRAAPGRPRRDSLLALGGQEHGQQDDGSEEDAIHTNVLVPLSRTRTASTVANQWVRTSPALRVVVSKSIASMARPYFTRRFFLGESMEFPTPSRPDGGATVMESP